MLALPISNSWGSIETNQDGGAAGSSVGTSVVPGASNAEGSATSLISSLTNDAYYVRLMVKNGAVSAAAKNHLLDFGWDPAGGTSYVWFFQNLVCGASGGTAAGDIGSTFHFPCYIPAGSQIAVRIQGSNATAGTVRVYIECYGKPSRPELWRPAAYAETIGAITNSSGVAFTPGNAAWGTRVSLGSTVKPLFWWELGVQIDNTAISNQGTMVELAIGDGTNFHTILRKHLSLKSSEEIQMTEAVSPYWCVPAGASLYVRGNCSGAPNTGYNAVAIGFGG